MTIYDITYNQVVNLLLPVKYRLAKFLAVLYSLVKPLQWLRDLFFEDYADGFTGDLYDSGLTYAKGDRVRDTDHKVYEALSSVPTTTKPSDNPTYWLKIQDNWIGIRERAKYNSQKLFLEYILNKWFDAEFRQPTSYTTDPNYYLPKSDIYIETTPINNLVFVVFNSDTLSSKVYASETLAINFVQNDYGFSGSAFTINVPAALWATLGPDDPSREAVIRATADKYVIYGITYTVTSY